MKNWIVVGTFFCLWISTMFEAVVQQYLAYALILSVGVLHGANDLAIIRFTTLKMGYSINFKKLTSGYVLVVVSVLAVFYSYPPLALTIFILISGFHFGEQHFKKFAKTGNPLMRVLFLIYGLTILFMIFYINLDKVNPIITDITGWQLSDTFFSVGFFGLLFATLGLLFFFKFRDYLKVNLWEELFYLLVLFVVFRTADLLWGFCIYFILWHSIPSLLDQIHMLYGNTGKNSVFNYLKSSWGYWAVSIAGLFVMYFLFGKDADFFISVLIYFLAAITFPHVLVMSKIEKKGLGRNYKEG